MACGDSGLGAETSGCVFKLGKSFDIRQITEGDLPVATHQPQPARSHVFDNDDSVGPQSLPRY